MITFQIKGLVSDKNQERESSQTLDYNELCNKDIKKLQKFLKPFSGQCQSDKNQERESSQTLDYSELCDKDI